MMHAMMRRSYEHIFQPSHFANHFRMHKDAPDLRGGIHKHNIQCLETHQCKGNKINETIQWLKYGRPEAYRKIHMLRRMMRDMHCPEQTDLMVETMQPVVQKIFQYDQHEPINHCVTE